MKKCPHCGAQTNDDSRFCTECGKEFPQGNVCPHCGAQMNDDSRFCTECGKELQQGYICSHCGASINEGDAFCQNCGKAINDVGGIAQSESYQEPYIKEASQNKKINPILIAAVTALLIGGVWWFYNSAKSPKIGNNTASADSIEEVMIDSAIEVTESIIEMSKEEVVKEALENIFSNGLKQKDQQEAILTYFSKDFRELNDKVNEVDIKSDAEVGFWDFDLWCGGSEGNPQKAIIKKIYNVTDNSADADVELILNGYSNERKFHLTKSSREEWVIDDIDNLKKTMREYIQQMNDIAQEDTTY